MWSDPETNHRRTKDADEDEKRIHKRNTDGKLEMLNQRNCGGGASSKLF